MSRLSKAASVTVDILNFPEALWAMRRELARVLRDEADGEPEVVARKLRSVADAFESGQAEDANGS